MKTEVASIDPFWWTVLPASVLFRAPMDTITRGAKTFSASLAHFDTVQVQRQSINAVTDLVQRCSVYWLNRLGWPQIVLKLLKKTFMILSGWCPLRHGKCHLPTIQFDWYQFWPLSVLDITFKTFFHREEEAIMVKMVRWATKAKTIDRVQITR